MDNQIWSWILTAVGVSCFFLAGNKVWWAWYVGLAGQVTWALYGVVTQQWGFLVGVVLYTVVYSKNAYQWTRERFKKPDVSLYERMQKATTSALKHGYMSVNEAREALNKLSEGYVPTWKLCGYGDNHPQHKWRSAGEETWYICPGLFPTFWNVVPTTEEGAQRRHISVHEYVQDPQSGAGNCTCGSAQHTIRHRHPYRKAEPAAFEKCVCGLLEGSRLHTLKE